MYRTLLALVAALAASAILAEENYRLPQGIAPTAQSVLLRLDPGVEDYSGHTHD